MKRVLAMLICSALTIGLMYAGGMEKKAGKTHEMTVQIVSVDVEGKMIVVKDEKGEEHKAPVMGKAVASLKTIKVGDKVTLTCQDDEKGEHKGVVKISPASTGS